MNYIDMHCDTLMMALMKDPKNGDLLRTSYMVDLEKMQKGDALAQFFAIFLLPEGAFQHMGIPPMTDDEYIDALYGYYQKNLKEHSDIFASATTVAEMLENKKNGKMSGVLTIEDGRSVNGDLNKLKKYYDMGVRAMNLTWNAPNCFGFPNSKDPEIMSKGLTDFGKEAVVYMQELGMMVDVSHLSDGGFYEVAKLANKPFIASHSNARSLSPHQRNLTDDMIKVLGEKGGITGLNFGPEFLNADLTCKDSTVALLAKHARHITNLGGIDVIGFGSDFDGVHGNLEISGPDKMGLLADALKKEGFSESDIEKIYYKNALRVLTETLK